MGTTLTDMAPRTQPTALKLVTGRRPGKDSGGRPVPPDAFGQGLGSAMYPPDWLTDPRAQAEWAAVAPTLSKLKLTKPEDRQTFAVYCQTVANMVRAQEKLDREGLTIEVEVATPSGGCFFKPVTNPVWRIVKESQDQLLKFAKEFGLTPVAGATLSLKRAAEADAGADDSNPFDGTKTGS